MIRVQKVLLEATVQRLVRYQIENKQSNNKCHNRSFSSDVTAAILVYQNNEMAAILVYGTGISSFLFKYFVLFHHPTGATDHVSENDLYKTKALPLNKCVHIIDTETFPLKHVSLPRCLFLSLKN